MDERPKRPVAGENQNEVFHPIECIFLRATALHMCVYILPVL